MSFDPNQSITNQEVGIYYGTWTDRWSNNAKDNSLAKIKKEVKIVLLAFAKPDLKYKKGANNFQGTGLEFCNTFSTIKDAIRIGRTLNGQKFFLSVGGATYHYSNNPNYKAISDLAEDLGVDGVDIDFEDPMTCSNKDSGKIKCTSDDQLIQIIQNLRKTLPSTIKLAMAPLSTGAFGTPEFKESEYYPYGSSYCGSAINPMLEAGKNLDYLFIMSYDAGPNFSPINAFDAYKHLANQSNKSMKIFIGIEVPPEAWGGHVITKEEIKEQADHLKANGGSGLFIWMYKKDTNNYPWIEETCIKELGI